MPINRSLPLCCLVFFTYTAAPAQTNLTLEDIWAKQTFRQEYIGELSSMKDGLHYTSQVSLGDQGSAVVKYAYRTGQPVDTLLKSSWLAPALDFDDYSFSADESKLLLSAETESIYRHSSMSHFWMYDIKSRKAEKVSEGQKQLFATMSPSGGRIAFVRGNNLFLVDPATKMEEQITTDGEANVVINGRTDWVYEEEFGFDKAFFWSPDGKKIAFYRFDESNVKQYSFARYGQNLYPEEYRFKYPKAGEENAKVSILVYDTETKKITNTGIRTTSDEYIPRIKWTNDPSLLCVYFMNRHQNELQLLLYNTGDKSQKTILHERSETWIDIDDDQFFLKDGKHFLWTSEAGGRNHIYLYTMDGQAVRQVTQGEWDVTQFYGVEEAGGTVYYASSEASPMQQHVYSVKLDGTGKARLSAEGGWNSAAFSAGYACYIHFRSDANTPAVITLHEKGGRNIRTLEDNAKLNAALKECNLRKREFFEFTTSGGTKLNGWMIKPPDFDASKKYPVLMYVYGGPGAQTVTDSWGGTRDLWHQYIAQQGYLIVSVDNRGTGGRGKAFKSSTYLQLGKYEMEDQVEAAKYLGTLPYIDKSRIGIHGWSYGGYMSSLCITKGADYFKAAIAVAPVTNWRFYDTIYTERYLRTPQENAAGYDENSPIHFADRLKGSYLLIHGMADDNVHFQNTAEMISALVKAGKPFDLYVYPDKNHSISGAAERLHLYTKMTEFLLENL